MNLIKRWQTFKALVWLKREFSVVVVGNYIFSSFHYLYKCLSKVTWLEVQYSQNSFEINILMIRLSERHRLFQLTSLSHILILNQTYISKQNNWRVVIDDVILYHNW